MTANHSLTTAESYFCMSPALRNLDLPAAASGETAKSAQEFVWFHLSSSGNAIEHELVRLTSPAVRERGTRGVGSWAGNWVALQSDITVRYSVRKVTDPMRYAYPYELRPQPEGGFTVTFPDVPEAITQGETEAEAAAMAEDALVTALSFYTDDAKPLPHPSPARARLAYLPPLVAAKLALHDAMLAASTTNVALASRLGVDEKVVRRLRDPLHKSRIDQVGEALRSLGKVIEIIVSDEALPEAGSLHPILDGWVRAGPQAAPRPHLLWSKRQVRNQPPRSRYCVATRSGRVDAQRRRNRQRVTA